MTNTRYSLFIIFGFYLLVYILPLGARDLLIPDEPRYAEIPREMLTSGDWVVPHLNGLRYFEKPPFGYWVHAAVQFVCGENNFAVRLPSALAAGFSSLFIFFLVRKCYRNDKDDGSFAPLLATFIHISSLAVAAIGNIALLDSVFSMLVTATVVFFFLATEAQTQRSKEKLFLILAGITCGLAILCKGFLGLALPILALAPYLLWQKRYLDLLRLSWLPVLIAFLVVLPWALTIHLREPDFWRYFIWNEHIRRFAGNDAQHKQSFFFFFYTAPGLFFPWFFLIPATIFGLRTKPQAAATARLQRLSLIWLILPFLLFSFSHGKLLTYILPCFPPFAILSAIGLSEVGTRGHRPSMQTGIWTLVLLYLLLLLALLTTQFWGPDRFHLFFATWKTYLLITALCCAMCLCVLATHRRAWQEKLLLIGLSPLALLFSAHYTIPDVVLVKSESISLLEEWKGQITGDTVIIACEETAGATGWALGRNDIYLLRPAGEFAYGLQYQDAAGRLVDPSAAADLITEHLGKAILIGRVEKVRDVQEKIAVTPNGQTMRPGGRYQLLKY